MSVLWIVLGLVSLVVGGEFLVRSSVSLSLKFNISKLVIGMTVVSFATSAPEFLVSLQAALNGSPDIALGNIIGSNIANIGLVLGITAIIAPLTMSSDFYKLNWPMMMLLSIALYYFLKSGDVLDFTEGLLLLLALIIFLIVLLRKSKGRHIETIVGVDGSLDKASNFKIVVWLLIGGSALYFGSSWLVFGAKEMAQSYGVSERIISITMVAVGTSIPELAASVIAAIKQEKAISLGNLIGSNIFNIASVLGVTAMIHPIALVNTKLLTNDIFWMIGFAAILIPFMLLPKRFEIGRLKGFVLLGAYILFIYSAISVD
ncbi:MAG: calcium/sodium antiporter [Xanthomarina sp.]